eukprot:g35912.t1
MLVYGVYERLCVHTCNAGAQRTCGSETCYATGFFLKLQPQYGCAGVNSTPSPTLYGSPSPPNTRSSSPSLSRSSTSSPSPSASLSSSASLTSSPSSPPPATVSFSSSPSPFPNSTVSASASGTIHPGFLPGGADGAFPATSTTASVTKVMDDSSTRDGSVSSSPSPHYIIVVSSGWPTWATYTVALFAILLVILCFTVSFLLVQRKRKARLLTPQTTGQGSSERSTPLV